MKKITYLLLFLLFSFAGLAQTTVTIGSGTNTGNKYPVSPYFGYSFSEQIVLQSEIANAGQITKLRFYMVGGVSLTSSNNWTIYLGHTSKTTFTTDTDWILSSAMTQVFSGTIAATPAAGWYEITLSGVFVYNNVDNLVVAVDENAASYNTSTNFARIWTTPVANRGIYYNSDSTNPDPSNVTLTGTRTAYINQMQFDIAPPPSCLPPTVLASSAITTSTATLGWTASTSSPTNGYDIYYSTTNTAPTALTAPTIQDTDAPYNATGLASSSVYYWWVRSDCDSETSAWASGGSFTTLKVEPINQITNLAAGAVTVTAIPLTWTAAVAGTQLPDGYLVKASSIDLVSILDPVDGTDPANVTAFTANEANKKQTTGTASSTTSFTGMNPGSMYHYKVYSYTNIGTSIDFKTDSPATLSHATRPRNINATLASEIITSTSISFDWTSADYLPATNEYLVFAKEASAVSGSATPLANPSSYTANAVFGSGTPFEADANAFCVYKGDGTSVNITGLNPSTTYHFTIYAVVDSANSNGTYTYSNDRNVNRMTSQIAATLPYTQDFSTASNFSFVNGTQANKWFYGSAVGNPANSIYVSSDVAGATNDYDIASTSTVQAYRDIAIPSGTTLASLSFDWKANGESCCDYLRVWLVPTSFVPTSGTQITTGTGRIQLGANFNSVTTWQTYANATLDLSSFANTTMRLVFEWRNDGSVGTQNAAAIDNISLFIPSCLAPTALTSSNITTTTVDLGWTASTSAPANGYEYYYATTNTAPDAMTTPSGSVGAGVTTATLTPLAGSTQYYYWVRANCGGGDYSTWAAGGSFTTACAPFTIPYSQNFDTTATGTSSVPSAPTCWSFLETTGGAGYGYTYAFGTPIGVNQFYLYNSSDATGSYMLVSPETQNLTDGLNRVKFSGKASAGYTLEVGTLSDPLDVNTFTLIETVTLTAAHVQYTVNIPSGSNSYLAFRHGLGGTYRTIYVDEITVEVAPSCLVPTALTTTNITATSVDVSWTATTSTPLVGYEFAVTTSATPPASGTAVSVTSATDSSLSASTTYYLHVRSECITGVDYSAWVTSASFTTSCLATDVPYLQDFESVTVPALPNCTSVEQAGTGNLWQTANNPSSVNGFSSNTLRYPYNGSNAANTWFYTQGINLTAGKTYKISYRYGNNGGTTYVEKLKVSYGTSPVNTAMTNSIADHPDVNSASITVEYNFTPNATGVNYFGFNAYSIADRNQLYVDDISIIEVPCPDTATWDGSTWTGTPSATAALVFDGDYTHATATNLDGCSCTINGTTAVNFTDGTLNLQNNLVIASGASLVLESGANLVQVNSTEPNSVLGTFTAKRNSADMVRLDYTAWSSPVVGQNALAFSPATLANRFYEFDSVGNAYSVVTPSTTNFTAGKGLLVRSPNTWVAAPAAGQAYPGVFTGVPNNGDLTAALGSGFSLLGNPYASPISANLLLTNTNNATLGMGTVYFWTHTLAASGGTYATNNYASHNGAGGLAAAAGGETPDGIIQVGQGFLVDGITAGNAEFNNGMRLSTSNGQFFKTTGAINQSLTIERHRMWFGLTSPGNRHNQILVGYIEGATNGIDTGLDAKLFEQTNSVLYSPINSSKYVIQSRELPFTTSDIVPLGLFAQTAGQYTITMDNLDGLFTGQDVFLRDNMLNITHDIKTTPYTFASDAGEFASRFEIVYASPLSVQTPTFTENSVVVYSNQSGININAGQTVIDNVKVFDVRGRLLVSKSKVNATSISIENVTTEKQVLLVQITSSDNITISKKVIN